MTKWELRALETLHIKDPSRSSPTVAMVAAGTTFYLAPGKDADDLIKSGRVEVLGWLNQYGERASGPPRTGPPPPQRSPLSPAPVHIPEPWIRMRAIGRCRTPVGERGPGDEFHLPFDTKDEREQLLWGISSGTWEVAGPVPPSWPVGHIRSTRGAAPA